MKVEKKSNTFGKWYWIGDGSGEITVDNIYSIITSGLGVAYNPLYIPSWCCKCFGVANNLFGKFGRLNPSILIGIGETTLLDSWSNDVRNVLK